MWGDCEWCVDGGAPGEEPSALLPWDHNVPLCVCVCVCVCVSTKSLSHVRLCYPMDGSPPGSSVHGILQARTLEWAAMPSSRGSSLPRD